MLLLYISFLCIFPIGLYYSQIAGRHDDLKLELFPESSPAKCLDGSPYGVNHAKGYNSGKNKVVIFLASGGWCYGRNKEDFYKDCIERSKGSQGSSKYWRDPAYWEKKSFIDGDSDFNPVFYNWNRFHFSNCDGTGHQGYKADPVQIGYSNLYFRGHNNTIEGFKFVFNKVKIEDVEEVVLTGWSTGGLATYYWIQYLADYIHKINNKVKVYGIPEGGFFVDYKNLHTNDNDFTLKQKTIFEEVNKEVLPVSSECVKENPDQMHMCLMAEYLIKYIKVPILMIQSGYDSYNLLRILGLDCVADLYGNINKCDQNQLKIAHQLKDYQTKLIETEVKIKNNLSVWSPSCVCHLHPEHLDKSLLKYWNVPKDSGNNYDYIVKKFIENEGKTQIVLLDKVDWPENNKCARKYNDQYEPFVDPAISPMSEQVISPISEPADFTAARNINCNELNCLSPNSCSNDKKTCICSLENAEWIMNHKLKEGEKRGDCESRGDCKSILLFCAYIRKNQLIYFLLEIFVNIGLGHFYAGNFGMGFGKIIVGFVSYIILFLLGCCKISSADKMELKTYPHYELKNQSTDEEIKDNKINSKLSRAPSYNSVPKLSSSETHSSKKIVGSDLEKAEGTRRDELILKNIFCGSNLKITASCIFTIWFFWWLVDVIMISTARYNDGMNVPLKHW